MASQSGEYNELDFTGESAEEAESFVQAVHRRAFAAGRQKDNTWIAEFACTCCSKKAVRWYDTLDEETQNDWKLLRRAILGEFTASPPAPATVPPAAPALVGSPSSTTPAARPPSAVTVKIGRIRVDSEDHTKCGYLEISPGSYGIVRPDSRNANIFEVDILARTFRFQGGGDSLIISPNGQNRPLSPQSEWSGLMKKASDDSGTQWNHTWFITEDGDITAVLRRTDGSQYDANFLVNSSVLNWVIHVPADKDVFLARYVHFGTRVSLRLEPLS